MFRLFNKRRSIRRIFANLVIILVLIGLLMVVVRYHRQDDMLSGQAYVIDGDTVKIGQTSIRLLGIDAPEREQKCQGPRGSYACGRAATRALKKMIGRNKITCRGWQLDIYDRLLATCRPANAKTGDNSFNRQMVSKGWAVSFYDYPAEEDSAKLAARGIWQGRFIRPAEWRKEYRAEDAYFVDLFKNIWQWMKNIARF